MATTLWDTDAAVTSVVAAQYDGSNLADIQTIARDAREDPTMEKSVLVPDTKGRQRRAYIGDWVFSVSTGVALVLDNASFAAIFNAHA